MTENRLYLEQDSGPVPGPTEFWPALMISGEEIDKEIQRLSLVESRPGGVRRSYIIHPAAEGVGRAIAPGIDVAINVILPGETTATTAQNASQIGFCIRGEGICHAGERSVAFAARDVWNIPSVTVCSYENTGTERAVFLCYSNAPMLKKLGIHYVALNPVSHPRKLEERTGPRPKDLALNAEVGPDGARVLGYEHLIDIDVVPSKPLHWPWREVSKHLAGVENLGGDAGKGYQGRHLVILYNPATERRNGTTHSFFASIAQYPSNKVDTPHRHTSAAINYIFSGSGHSSVHGREFSWKAGDLMLSAPGWAVHNHASGAEGANILTVQDHPLQIAQESLMWQETLKDAIVKLGAEEGIQTNLAQAVAAE